MHEVIQTSIMITVFVMLMMLIIEYVNIQTRGQWSQPLKEKRWLQILMAALFGAIPGCLGVYTIVSLFTHKIVSFGALVASMIATSGDEAFIMFAMMPEKAVWLTLFIFILAIVAGFITDIFYKNVNFSKHKDHHFHIHQEETKCNCFSSQQVLTNFKTLNFTRALMLTGLILFGINLIIGSDHHNHSFTINKEVFSTPAFNENVSENLLLPGHGKDHEHGHEHEFEHNKSEIDSAKEAVDIHEGHDHASEQGNLNLPKIIFIVLSILAFFILVTVPDHFIEEHVWNHVIKKHFLKIFFWTFGTLLLMFLVNNYLDFNLAEFATNNLWLFLVAAVLIGILPESGPHMVFISLFVAGIIPISILVASSIVQDGHGSLPLFAENKKAFFHMKLINMAMGIIIGSVGLLFGF